MDETLTRKLPRNKNKFLAVYLSIGAVLIGLMTIFTFYDLDLSAALYGYDDGFGRFFSDAFYIIGYLPAILVNAFLFIIIFWYFDKVWVKILMGFIIYGHFFGAFFVGVEMFNFDKPVLFGICGGVATVVGFLAVFGAKFIKKETLKSLIYITILSVVFASICNSVSAVFQIVWGRPRYFTLAGINLPGFDYSPSDVRDAVFSPWYSPTGGSYSFQSHSFPSLHATSSISALYLILLAFRLNFKKITKALLSVCAMIVVIGVPLSRVVRGHHYMTDVTFSLIIGYLTVLAAVALWDCIYKAYFKKRTVSEQV